MLTPPVWKQVYKLVKRRREKGNEEKEERVFYWASNLDSRLTRNEDLEE